MSTKTKRVRIRRTPPRPVADSGFPGRLRWAIKSHGYTVSELGRRIGRSEACVRKWINGKSEPNATDLILMASKAGLSCSRLLGVS